MITSVKWNLVFAACLPMFLNACVDEQTAYEAVISSDGTFESYSGNQSPAPLTQQSTLSFIEALYPTTTFENVPYTQTSANRSGDSKGLLKHQRVIANAALAQAMPQQNSQPDSGIYDFKHCSYNGSAKQNDSKASGAKQASSYQFTDCQQHKGITLNGSVTLSTQKANQVSEHTITFRDLVLSDNGKNFQYSGSMQVLKGQNEQITSMDLERIDHDAKTLYFRNIVWIDGESDQLTGRIYDAVNGYVELRSGDVLKFDADGILSQGRLYLHGSDYAKASLSKPNNNQYGAAHIELDEHGDGFYETHISKNMIYSKQPTFFAAR